MKDRKRKEMLPLIDCELIYTFSNLWCFDSITDVSKKVYVSLE